MKGKCFLTYLMFLIMGFMGLVFLFAWMVDIVVHVGKYSIHEIQWVYGFGL